MFSQGWATESGGSVEEKLLSLGIKFKPIMEAGMPC